MKVIIDNKEIDAPHINGWNWRSDPKIAPHCTDGHRRDADDACAVMWHTSSGKLCRTLHPDSIPSTHEVRLAKYQSNTDREVSWHFTCGTDGDTVQQADPELWLAWHAGWANSWTVGGELAQIDDKGTLTKPQIVSAADLTDILCDSMGIPKRVLVDPGTGLPWLGPVRQLISKRAVDRHGKSFNGMQQTWDGVIAHSHVAHRDAKSGARGPGDPGPLLFEELIRRGYARHPVFSDGTIGGTPLPPISRVIP